MPRYNIIYESDERILGHLQQAKEWIIYNARLKIKNGGKKPVSLDMEFEPPHPFPFNMPEKHSIKGESITDCYAKLVKYFNKFGIILKS